MLLFEETFFHCCVPGKYKDPVKSDQALEALDEKLTNESTKPFLPSGHAFVTFDSIKATEACLAHFKLGWCSQIRLVFQELNDRVVACFTQPLIDVSRGRSKSTFFNFTDLDDEELTHMYDRAVLLMQKATEPTDILWKNITGTRGMFIIRRAFFTCVLIGTLFFVTTPTVIFFNLK